jgi:predicted PurR-regulated permease PerM
MATKSTPRVAAEERSDGRAKLPVDAGSRQIGRAVLGALLLGLVIWVAWDFLPALAWASMIALTTWPLYVRFAALFGRRTGQSVAALLFTLLVGIVLLIPIVLLLRQAAQDCQTILQGINQLRENGIPVPSWVSQLPLASEQVAIWWRSNLSDPKAVEGWLAGINLETAGAWIGAFGGQLLHRIAMFFFALLALFFLYRDGPWIGARLLDTADRLLGDPGERLAGKMIEAVRGTVNGTVVVAVAEGCIIGIGYLLAGVPNAFLFIVLTIAFAMLPFGAWAAFTAASLLLLAHGGSALAAAGVFGFGAFVMLVGDHFVWPTLVGGAARLPFLAALIGIFGGLQVFGLLGLFVGPVVMAAFLTVWREWLIQPQTERNI